MNPLRTPPRSYEQQFRQMYIGEQQQQLYKLHILLLLLLLNRTDIIMWVHCSCAGTLAGAPLLVNCGNNRSNIAVIADS